MILKISNTKLAKLRKSKVKIIDNGKGKFDGKNEFNNNKIDSSEVKNKEVEDDEIVKKKNYQKKSKSKNYQKIFKSKKIVSFLDFSITGARLIFTKLR